MSRNRNGKQAASVATMSTDAVEETDADLAYQAAYQATLTQNRYKLLEARAVRLGRQGGVSWDKLGGWLSVPGETLRRRYGEMES
jgi:hypothetical protein